MEEQRDVLLTLKKLPLQCFTTNRATGQTIGIRRGVMGYYPIVTPLTPEELNVGVTKYQVTAMENGSMFGWEIPGADPDYLEEMDKKRAAA